MQEVAHESRRRIQFAAHEGTRAIEPQFKIRLVRYTVPHYSVVVLLRRPQCNHGENQYDYGGPAANSRVVINDARVVFIHMAVAVSAID